MVAVIFEAIPHADQWDRYLDLAAQLRPELEQMPGFLSIERYQSLSTPGKILSLSFWANEDSIAEWRNVELHRRAQAEGRKSVFLNYQIRIATVSRNYGLNERHEAPCDSRAFHH